MRDLPSISPGLIDFIRVAYGVLMAATLLAVIPHARRYFLTDRWRGYGEAGPWTNAVQNPVVMPVVVTLWIGSAVALAAGRMVVAAALVNVLLCRYFFIQMRWRGVLRGMGAPGFIAYWLGVAVLLLEYTRRFAPDLQTLALLVLQVDFAFIMLSAGTYKFAAGYRQNNGMELGMVNPEWGYWPRFWSGVSPDSRWFRTFNQLAWATEVVAAILMLIPATRLLGGLLLLVSFVFIATQIRLGFLCEMVIVCCLLFAYPGSAIDGLVAGMGGAPVVSAVSADGSAAVNGVLAAVLWGYLLLLPLARAGLAYNFYSQKVLPAGLQRVLDAYTNFWGLIIWRVFSADITNFFVEIFEQGPDGVRTAISDWGRSLRYAQVAESIAVTSVFTTLKYYPSNRTLFVARLVRYARSIPRNPGAVLVFQYTRIVKQPHGFAWQASTEFLVDPDAGTVTEQVLDASVRIDAPAERSPIHEAARPGSYAPHSKYVVSAFRRTTRVRLKPDTTY